MARAGRKTTVVAVASLKSTKSLKIRKKKSFCAIASSPPRSTHNLKVIGSNPIPATKFSLFCAYVSNRLQEALWKQEGA